MVPRPVFTEYSKPSVTLPDISELHLGNKEVHEDLFYFQHLFIIKVFSYEAFGASVCHAIQ